MVKNMVQEFEDICAARRAESKKLIAESTNSVLGKRTRAQAMQDHPLSAPTI